MKKLSIVALLLAVCLVISGGLLSVSATETTGNETGESQTTQESSQESVSSTPAGSTTSSEASSDGSSSTGSTSSTSSTTSSDAVSSESSNAGSSDTSSSGSTSSEETSSGNASSTTSSGTESTTSSNTSKPVTSSKPVSSATPVKPSKPTVGVTVPMLKEVKVQDVATEKDLSSSFSIDHENKKVVGKVAFEVAEIAVSAKTTVEKTTVSVASPISLQEGENKAGVLRFTYKDASGKDQAVVYELIVERAAEVIQSETESLLPEDEENNGEKKDKETDPVMMAWGIGLLIVGLLLLAYGIFDCVLAVLQKKAKKEGKKSEPAVIASAKKEGSARKEVPAEKKVQKFHRMPVYQASRGKHEPGSRKDLLLEQEEEEMSDLFAAGTLKEDLSEEDFVDISDLKKKK